MSKFKRLLYTKYIREAYYKIIKYNYGLHTRRSQTKIVPTKTASVQIGPKYYYQSGQIGMKS